MKRSFVIIFSAVALLFGSDAQKLSSILNHKLLADENITVLYVRVYGQASLQTKDILNEILVADIALNNSPKNLNKIYSPWAISEGMFEESCDNPMTAKFDKLCGTFYTTKQVNAEYPLKMGAMLILDRKDNDLHILLETLQYKEISSGEYDHIEYMASGKYAFHKGVRVPPHVLTQSKNSDTYIYWDGNVYVFQCCE
jgi:hypothetical protein